MSTKRVLSIGQCAADHYGIRLALSTHFGAEVTAAANEKQAVALLGQGGFALVLVNRILDGDGASGVAMIPRLKALPGAPPIMLVTNYPEYQDQAVAAGAVPGFGKAALEEPETLELLTRYLR